MNRAERHFPRHKHQLATLFQHDIGSASYQPLGIAGANPASVFILQGIIIMPSVRNEPEEMVAA